MSVLPVTPSFVSLPTWKQIGSRWAGQRYGESSERAAWYQGVARAWPGLVYGDGHRIDWLLCVNGADGVLVF